MMVATESFTTRDPWTGPVQITRGQSFIDSDHVIVKLHRECFEPADRSRASRDRIRPLGTARLAATRTTLPATPSGREAWRLHPPALNGECFLSERPSGVRVRLSSTADAEIVSVFERTTDIDGYEAGVLLFGRTSRDLVDVVTAVGAPTAERSRTHLRLDVERAAQVIEAMEERGLQFVGDAHSHPASGRVDPSPTDLASIAGGGDRYLSIVAVRLRSGWALQAWIVRGRLCQPADII